MKDPGSRLMKFRTKLEAFNFAIEYTPRKHNVTADALSRIIVGQLQGMASCMAVTRQQTKNNNNNDVESEFAANKVVQPASFAA